MFGDPPVPTHSAKVAPLIITQHTGLEMTPLFQEYWPEITPPPILVKYHPFSSFKKL